MTQLSCHFALALALYTPSALAQIHSGYTARLTAEVNGVISRPARASLQVRVGQSVVLRVEASDRNGRVVALPAGSSVTFFRVESTLAHVRFAPPNPGNQAFSNAVLFGPRHGRWLGYDRLEYTSSPVVNSPGFEVRSDSLTVSAAHPSDPALDVHGEAGSVWISAEITLPEGAVLTTPSARDTDRLGLSAQVTRVSFRESDDFIGWLSTYFNVPDVFGSNGSSGLMHQTDRYVGADCADVLVGALRASGRDIPYTSVAGIGAYATAVSPVIHLAPGGPPSSLRWGSDVLPGDLITLDYSHDPRNDLPRAWDHIGALLRDNASTGGPGGSPGGLPDGRLGPEDFMREMGSRGLTDGPIHNQGPIRAVIWRWRATASHHATRRAPR